ncbi:MAG: polymer-forming cytoskeletal protein [Ghiorsea sp.]|nr:polymer-forming cytoskeletal protein [Ghiorsea sp.]
MFSKKEQKQAKSMKEAQHIDTLIGIHSVFTGNLSFEGAVRIDGRFEGNIQSEQEGTLIVSEGAFIKGEVNVPNLILHGDINGDVRANQSLKIGSKGVLNGDVLYKVLSLAEGASMNGRCSRIDEVLDKDTKTKKNDEKMIKVK